MTKGDCHEYGCCCGVTRDGISCAVAMLSLEESLVEDQKQQRLKVDPDCVPRALPLSSGVYTRTLSARLLCAFLAMHTGTLKHAINRHNHLTQHVLKRAPHYGRARCAAEVLTYAMWSER